jgi:hypothetical protein
MKFLIFFFKMWKVATTEFSSWVVWLARSYAWLAKGSESVACLVIFAWPAKSKQKNIQTQSKPDESR